MKGIIKLSKIENPKIGKQALFAYEGEFHVAKLFTKAGDLWVIEFKFEGITVGNARAKEDLHSIIIENDIYRNATEEHLKGVTVFTYNLNYDDWQYVLDNNLIGTEVNFDIERTVKVLSIDSSKNEDLRPDWVHTFNEAMAFGYQRAKIIRPKKMYTEKELKQWMINCSGKYAGHTTDIEEFVDAFFERNKTE